jgi:predicted nuclease with TOPRIM domain
MALLPAHEGIDLASRDDLVGMSDAVGSRMNRLEDRFDRLEDRFDRLETRFDGLETRMNQRFDAVNQRLDRLFLTLAAGLIAMIATVFAQALL